MSIFAAFTLTKPINNFTVALVQRMNLKQAEAIGDGEKMSEYVETFITTRVLLSNDENADTGEAFKESYLESMAFADVTVFAEIMNDIMSPDIGKGSDVEGDGYERAIFVPLVYPITLKGSDNEHKITAFEFTARAYGRVRHMIDTDGETGMVRKFIQNFGSLVGTAMPVSDVILDRLDYHDVARIKKFAMGKFDRAGQKVYKKR